MKKICFLIVSNLICICLHAQNFQWAKRAGLYAFDAGYGVGTDNAGNVYIAGRFEMNANFGGTYVKCVGGHDIYIAKYSSSGAFKWVRTAGSTSGDYAWAMAVDGAGNSYITGEMEQTTRFGSVALKSRGSNDVFVAKYDTNGNLKWAKNLGGGGGSDRGKGISISGGSIYITGAFQGGNFSGVYLPTSGSTDIFVAKMTTDGAFQWIKKAGGKGGDEGHAISNDQSGNVYVTGYFTGTANFSGTSITSKGSSDIFIAKYSPSGSLIWVKKAGGSANDAGNGIKVDNSGRVFITGGFRNTSAFGSIILKSSGGNSDIFIACYNSSGTAVWAKKAGGWSNDTGKGIAVGGNSSVFITGNYGNSATFGSKTITGSDATEIFVASYDASGNFRWVLKAGGQADVFDNNRYNETGLSISADPYGGVYASGIYRSKSTFGGTTLSPWSTHSQIFLTKIGSASGMLADTSNLQITPFKTASFCKGGDVVLKTIEDSTYVYSWKKDGILIKDAIHADFKADSPGSYSVVIISGNDTITTEPTIVTESASIAVSIAPSEPIFCQDSSTVLITNTGDEFVYEWKRNGKIIPGAIQKSYKADEPGDYQVKIIQGSCFNWSGITNISLQSCPDQDSLINRDIGLYAQEDTISLETKGNSLLVQIYPNPNNGLFTLEINMVHVYDQTTQALIEILNSQGQMVYYNIVSSDNGYINEHIELEDTLPSGIYFLQVSLGEKMEKTRMLLTR